MGYYVRHTMTFDQPKWAESVLVWLLTDGKDPWSYLFDLNLGDRGRFAPQESGSWYNREEDMIRLSQAFPHILFTVHCVGEDGAEWRVYARNGRTVENVAQLIWPDINLDKEVPAP